MYLYRENPRKLPENVLNLRSPLFRRRKSIVVAIVVKGIIGEAVLQKKYEKPLKAKEKSIENGCFLCFFGLSDKT